jgi:hypothetical protein
LPPLIANEEAATAEAATRAEASALLIPRIVVWGSGSDALLAK